MRSPRSSRTGSRKSRPDRVALRSHRVRLLIATLVLSCAAPAAAQLRHEATVVTDDDFIAISVRASGVEPETLFSNLEQGLSARVDFEIRALERRDGAMTLLGPRLIREFTVIHEVQWDPFRRRYVITTQDGARYPFRDEASLLTFLVELPDFRIPWSALEYAAGDGVIARAEREPVPRRPGSLMIETRVVYRPIVFVPGLSILTVFLPDSRMTTPWQLVPIEEES